MQTPISIIRDPARPCCATCSHARLITYEPSNPLLAECLLQPNAYDRTGRHPFVTMVANTQRCKRHRFRNTPATIHQRHKEKP